MIGDESISYCPNCGEGITADAEFWLEMGTKLEKKDGGGNEKNYFKIIVIVGIILIAIFMVFGFIYFYGDLVDGGVEDIHSLDVRVRGDLENGPVEYRVWADNLQSGNPNVRFEIMYDPPPISIWIYNRENELFYGYDHEENKWQYFPGSMGTPIRKLALSLDDSISSDGTGLSMEFENRELNIVVNKVNKDLSSDLFLPPPGAEAENALYFENIDF